MLSTKHSLKSEYKPYDSKSYILHKKRRNFNIFIEYNKKYIFEVITW